MGDTSASRAVVCQTGGRRFALALEDVREVCTDTPVIRMPGVAAPVEGVANVRGTVVTVVRAADLLGVAPSRPGPSPWLVVLRFREGRVALGVEDIEDLAPVGAGLTRLAVDTHLDPLFGSR